MLEPRQYILHILRGWLLLGGGCLCAENKEENSRRADVPQFKAEAAWFKLMSEQQGYVTNNRFDVVFIGDSLTEFWASIGKAVWPGKFAPLKCANCGITGDRTEHILYRIEHLDFRRANPQAFVLLMGTNNLGMEHPDKPEDVVRAVVRAANSLAKRHAKSKVVILEIPPSGLEPRTPLREGIKQANALLEKAALPAQASIVSIYDIFTDENDRWRDGLTLDGTHFSAAGYLKLAELLEPKLKGLLGSK